MIDYSQVELCILALAKSSGGGEDIHAQVASKMYDVSLDEVTPVMRRHAKDVNYGVIYGRRFGFK